MRYLLTIGAVAWIVAVLLTTPPGLTRGWGGGTNCTSTRVGNTTYTHCW